MSAGTGRIEQLGASVKECIVERVPLVVTHRSDNVRYLRTKATRMGHLWPAAPEACRRVGHAAHDLAVALEHAQGLAAGDLPEPNRAVMGSAHQVVTIR